MNAVTKYMLAGCLIAIMTISGFAFYSIYQYQAAEVRDEHARLESAIRTFWELLGHKGQGFRVVDGRLFIGNYLINNNFEVPDTVQEIFGMEATIFLGDERVSTNVRDGEGKRAVGTRLVGPVHTAIFKEGKPYRGEARVLGIPYLTAYDPIRDSDGTIVGVLFVGVRESEFIAGISDLKNHMMLSLFAILAIFTTIMALLGREIQKIGRKNEQQLAFQQTLIDTIPSPVFCKDTAFRYTGCNKAFESFIGYSRDELIGRTPDELWPKDLADRYLQQDRSLFDNPGFQCYEGPARCADGTVRDVIFNKATYNGSAGTLEGLVGVMLDITERKAAEEEIKNVCQELFDIVDFLPDATFVVDKDKRVIAWNRAIEKMTGLNKEAVLGEGNHVYSTLFYGEPRPVLVDLVDESLDVVSGDYPAVTREGRTLFTEVFVPSFRNGDSRYFWATASPLLDTRGTMVGAIESIRDITDYKRAGEEKSRLESQLCQAQMTETLMLRLGHDLKTPLTPLMILLPLIKNRVSDPEVVKMVDMCRENINCIKALAEKSKMFVSLVSAIEPYDYQAITLVAAVEEYVAESAALFAAKSVSCRISIDPLIVVPVVPVQLKELLANLICNAVHYSPEHGVIYIAAEQHAEAVSVSLRDEGVGLTADHLEHIFDEFFKADESRHELGTSGLGLSICKRIVRNHHGRIWAESAGLGQGTTISFTLNQHANAMQRSEKETAANG